MNWKEINRTREYLGTLASVSKDANGESLCDSPIRVLNIEKYSQDNHYKCSTVDAITMKLDPYFSPSEMNLIEFKGGTDPEDWNDHEEDTFYKKGFDTIHILLRDIISDTNSWTSIFSDKCNLRYFICLSDENILFQKKDISAKSKIHTRPQTVKARNKIQVRRVSEALSSCSMRHPFSEINIIPASQLTSMI